MTIREERTELVLFEDDITCPENLIVQIKILLELTGGFIKVRYKINLQISNTFHNY